MKVADPRTNSPTRTSVLADSRMQRLVTLYLGDENVSGPIPRTMPWISPVAVVAMKSREMRPPDHSPVGTRTLYPLGSLGDVISTISAAGVSTLSPTTAPWRLPREPANVNVAPWAANPAIAYATRNVALPEMRAPTEPPIEDDAQVALPLKEMGPLIDREPDVPAVRMFVEM